MNESLFEFKLCNASVESIHNESRLTLNTFGGHFNNMFILAQNPLIGIPLLKIVFRNIFVGFLDLHLQCTIYGRRKILIKQV